MVSHSVIAQVSVAIVDSSASIRSGSKILVRAVVENTSTSEKNYTLSYVFQPFEAIGTLPASITLLPNESKNILIQLYIPKRLQADKPYDIQVNVEANQIQYQAMLPISILRETNIIVQTLEPKILLESWVPVIQYQVRCNNAGNTSANIILEQIDYYQTSKKDSPVTVYLAPGRDTVLQIKKQIPVMNRSETNYAFLLTASLEHEPVFYSASMSANLLTSTRTYPEFLSSNNHFTTNRLAIFSKYTGNANHYYELNYNNVHQLRNADLHLQTNAYYYPASDNKLILANSFLDLTKGNTALRVGSIQHSGENSFSGRGASLTVTSKSKAILKMGYLNSRYNLLESFNTSSPFKPADLVFIQLEKAISPGINFTGVLNRLWNPQQLTNTNLAGANFTWHSKHKSHKIELGSYVTQAETNPKSVNNSYQNKIGIAGSVHYEWHKKSWQFLSRNYISSRHYGGARTGVIDFDEQITYQYKKGNIWSRYARFKNNPAPLYVNHYFGQNHYYNESLELGWSQQLPNNITFTLKPYFQKEQVSALMLLHPQDQVQHVARIQTKLNLPFNTNSLFYLHNETSYLLKTTIPSYKNTVAHRLTAMYKIQWFSVSLQAQHGPFYLNDMLLYNLVKRKYALYTLTPTITKSFLQNNLNIVVGSNINYERTFQRWSNNITLNTQYNVSESLAFMANYNRQQFSLFNPINMLDLGIVKQLHNRGAQKNLGRLVLFIYEDNNANKMYDAGDQIANNVIVTINNESFKPNSAGKLTYHGIPNGSYSVSIQAPNGYLQEDVMIIINGKTSQQIPLVKTARITGQIIVKKEALSVSTNEPISGIKVVATSDKVGRLETVTDEGGNFVLYAPEGFYTVQVIAESLSDAYELLTAPKKIHLTLKKTPRRLLFEVLAKVRKSKIIRFSSM